MFDCMPGGDAYWVVVCTARQYLAQAGGRGHSSQNGAVFSRYDAPIGINLDLDLGGSEILSDH